MLSVGPGGFGAAAEEEEEEEEEEGFVWTYSPQHSIVQSSQWDWAFDLRGVHLSSPSLPSLLILLLLLLFIFFFSFFSFTSFLPH